MNYISGLNFLKISDTFMLFQENHSRIIGNETFIEELTSKEDPIVFCKADYIDQLFTILKDTKKNCSVVTHQSDLNITKHDYIKKPNNVTSWFAQNINFSSSDLIPIPIGFSDSYTLGTKYYDLHPFISEEKTNFVYVNFRTETFKERKKIKKQLISNRNLTFSEPRQRGNNLEYIKELSSHKYCICPRGNGLDTHRVWEALYLNTIPIVQDCIMYRKMKEIEPSIPFVFTKDFSDIDWESLNRDYETPNINSNIFNVEFWINER